MQAAAQAGQASLRMGAFTSLPILTIGSRDWRYLANLAGGEKTQICGKVEQLGRRGMRKSSYRCAVNSGCAQAGIRIVIDTEGG